MDFNKEYTVRQLARLAGVSIKTLHHYDRIGLLKPKRRSEKNYRYYGRTELLLLQQILFYRELGFPLAQIREIISQEDFDILKALESHQEVLLQQMDHLQELVLTLKKTIAFMKKKEEKLNPEDLYKGFQVSEREAIREEVAERWGADQLRAVEERLLALTKKEWADQQEEGEAVNHLLADLMELPPDHELVQKAIAKHHDYLNNFYEVLPDRYLGLGKMYTEDDRFRAYYDQYAEGLADFLYEAIQIYCRD